MGVRWQEPRQGPEQALQPGLRVSDHQTRQGNEEDEKREEEQQEEVGKLAGEAEQVVASYPEHHFPQHPEAENTFQVRVEIAHARVGYPVRWVSTTTLDFRETPSVLTPENLPTRRLDQ